MRPVLMVYELREINRRIVPFAAMRLGVRLRWVNPAEYGLPLHRLLEGQPTEGSGEELGGEMLVMAEFPGDLANRFLQELSRMKAQPIARKAILTPTNRQWDSRTLYRELGLEHEALRRGAPGAHAGHNGREES